MHDLSTDEKRRNFIADEIKKRLIGPGYTEDAFLCKEDASDEILDQKPTTYYTAGILYPKGDEAEDSALNDNETSITQNHGIIDDTQEDGCDDTLQGDSDDSNVSDGADKKSQDSSSDIRINERPNFRPSKIGAVLCLKKETAEIELCINYGIYHNINKDVKQKVKVKFGRCTTEQLNTAFKEYDVNASVQAELKKFGYETTRDLFEIDEQNKTISPKKIFSITENGKDKYLKPSIFPVSLRKKAAKLLISILKAPHKSKELKTITKKEFLAQIQAFDQIDEINNILGQVNMTSLADLFEFDAENCVKTNLKRSQKIDLKDIDLDSALKVDDPVKDYLLPLLLQYDFYQREQIKRRIKIDLNDTTKKLDIPKDDHITIRWKVWTKSDKKYVRILVENRYSPKPERNEDGQKTTNREAYMHQTEMKVSAEGIVRYTDPHHSVIDKEYNLNEELYRDVPMYGKGINCAIEWEMNTESPTWVKTSYYPRQKAAEFAPKTKYDDVNEICKVYDLTIWSKLEKDRIINRVKKLPEYYQIWQQEQQKLAGKSCVLHDVLKTQKEFEQRISENIKYLEDNDRAFQCFLLANTAMFIQMRIARDPKFKKNRDYSLFYQDETIYNDGAWNYFATRPDKDEPEYRPFQLAFLVMNIKSTFENEDKYRNDCVDLIWFPTGGGKTEAYLALTALTIAERRTSPNINEDTRGVSVIMRYTLRLLTAQQFERASFLICALEYLRTALKTYRNLPQLDRDNENIPITIGMWIGRNQTPNEINVLKTDIKYKEYYKNEVTSSNPFPVSYCPWCGCKLTTIQSNRFLHGYQMDNGGVHCINNNCKFYNGLPIYYIDEQLYNNPPTLLFATVDKFAQIKNQITGQLFGAGTTRRKPDLIIQDELHLISGPLGSLVGMFETMVEELCTQRNSDGEIIRRPKIIASTATTRNTHSLIQQLYTREVKSFPVSGVRYDDNFFSYTLAEKKRLYIGVAPTGHSASELEINSIAAEITAKQKLFWKYLEGKGVNLNDKEAVVNAICSKKDNEEYELVSDLDNYWSLVLYYINLKSLGRTHSRISQEILSKAKAMCAYWPGYPSLDFIVKNFNLRTREFTSRIESSKIKEQLVEAESKTQFKVSGDYNMRVTSSMDIVQATNMISVGIDIDRWNVMFMVGQPLATGEYIQSSSRVGRHTHGLVINILNSLRMRELSYYENYVPFHQVFYKHVEPLSVTTFTKTTLEKMILNLYFCYMGAIKMRNTPNDIQQADIDAFKTLLKNRYNNITNKSILNALIDKKVDDVHTYMSNDTRKNIAFGNYNYGTNELSSLRDFSLMDSLRDVESNTYILLNPTI